MNIDTLSDNKIQISLTDEEVSSIFGGYDKINYNNPQAKLRLNSFLNSVIVSANFSLDSKSLIVEIRQEITGCSITLTKIYGKFHRKRRRLKLKGRIVLFDTADEMIDSITALCKSNILVKKSTLYLLNNQYRLLLYTAATDELLLEYLQNISNNKTVISYTEEHGTPLCPENAVKTLGKIFS